VDLGRGSEEIALEPSRGLDLDPLGAVDVADHLAADLDRTGFDLALDRSLGADHHAALEVDLALHQAVDLELGRTGYLADDLRAVGDVGVIGARLGAGWTRGGPGR